MIDQVDQVAERSDVEQQTSVERVTAVAVLDGDLIYTVVNTAFCALLDRSPEQIVGQPVTAFMETWFGRSISQLPFADIRVNDETVAFALGPAEGHRLLLSCSVGYSRAGGMMFVLIVTPVAHTLSSEQLIAYATQLERSVMAGRHEVYRSREAANGLRTLLLMSISNRTLAEMLDYVYQQSQRLLDAIGMVVLGSPGFFVALRSPDQAEILYRSGTGTEISLIDVLDDALLTQLNVQHSSISIPDRSLTGTSRIFSRLVAPLLVEDEVRGVVIFDLTSANMSLSAHQDAMWLADQVIVAQGADRLQQKAKTASALQERERLAREMHDAAMQSTYSLTLFAEAGRRLASLGQIDRVKDYLQQLSETAQLALKELRLLLYELQPAVLEQVGLIGALRQRLESVESRTGMTARLEVDSELALPASIEDGLYRICQEALNNALKHASASEVIVTLGVSNGVLHLEICDNGIGFSTDDPKIMSGEGMTTMRERVRLMHAKLFIEATPQKGACVRVLMSIPNVADHLSE